MYSGYSVCRFHESLSHGLCNLQTQLMDDGSSVRLLAGATVSAEYLKEVGGAHHMETGTREAGSCLRAGALARCLSEPESRS